MKRQALVTKTLKAQMSTGQRQMRRRRKLGVVMGMMIQMRTTPPSQRTQSLVKHWACVLLLGLSGFFMLMTCGTTEDEDDGEEESGEESGKDWDELEEEAKKGEAVIFH